jgi:hypothetical protein
MKESSNILPLILLGSVINKESFGYNFMLVLMICVKVLAENAKNEKLNLGQITKKNRLLLPKEARISKILNFQLHPNLLRDNL